jgi:hypothetical protein
MEKKIGFFEESEGVFSMNRLMCFIVLIFAIIISSYIFISDSFSSGIATFSALAIYAFGAKYLQRSQEDKKL